MHTISDLNYKGTVLRVAVPSPLRRYFDYLPPQHVDLGGVRTGIRVLVPFGKRQLVGVLVELATESNLPRSRLKAAIEILDREPLYSLPMQRVLNWASHYYQCPPGEVYATALPAKLRSPKTRKIQPKYWKQSEFPNTEALELLGRAPQQKRLYELIGTGECPTTEQCIVAGFSLQLLRELERKRLIAEQDQHLAATPFDSASEVNVASFTLTQAQVLALNTIESYLDGFACFLVDGVTGSGKTEVYMRAMQTQLAKGNQCLVLVPEIGLTPQTVMHFEKRFRVPVVTLHSGLNDSERLNAWNAAQDGQAGIIIGTRSAIFTPMAKPGLIVVDEEHDSSFKQQDGFRYSARDLALVRGREEKICVILGSATPSMESIQNAKSGKFYHLQLKDRAGKAGTATIEIIDIATARLHEGFSELLLYKIEKHLQMGNQVLVFINRRGFAPVLNCTSCGWTAECDNCAAQLTIHSKPPAMRCHHCGAVKHLPVNCPICKLKSLTTVGIGTQKIEKFLQERFQETKVLRIDRDSVRNKSQMQEKFAQVHKGEACILLGTQMLAKGHHFPKITLVAILDADAGLFSADFRGQEQMAQTIIQVAGRAGRADKPGEVLIQSRHAGHAVLQSLVNGDYSAFSNLLLKERKQTGMPPFSYLALVRAESKDVQQPPVYLQKVRSHVEDMLSSQGSPSLFLLGPIPAPMEKRAGRYRWQLLLRGSNRSAMQGLMADLCHFLENTKTPSHLRWSVDIDPLDLI